MRRRFGRPLRRMLGRDIPPLLIQANQDLSAGKYAEAATDLEQLARAAEVRGGHRAPVFHIQAGRARLMAGQPAEALESMERGFGLLAARGRPRRLARIGSRVVAELSQRGFAAESKKLADYLESLEPGFRTIAPPEAAVKRPPLPTHCPGCGAPVRPDEVEWLDDVTAECAFCGSPVRGD
jgi:hypothetical protein